MLNVAPIVNTDQAGLKQDKVIWLPDQSRLDIPVVSKDEYDMTYCIYLKCMSPIKNFGVTIKDDTGAFLVPVDDMYRFRIGEEQYKLENGVYRFEVYKGYEMVKQLFILLNF